MWGVRVKQSDSKLLVKLVNTGTRKSKPPLQESISASKRYKEKTGASNESSSGTRNDGDNNNRKLSDGSKNGAAFIN